jgi:membrane protease YdiL (CAAX protease family)
MIFTTAIMLLILTYMWVAVPLLGGDPRASALLILGILGLCAWANARSGATWGFRKEQMAPALRWTLAFTLPAVALLLAVGLEIGTLASRDRLVLRFALLLTWALAQQFVLQTVILREARQRFSRGTAIVIAASIFALIHLPNPFLTPATFVAGLAWCWIYERHPNLFPIALSHAAASLTALLALGPQITGGMRVGYGYFLAHGIWF